MDDLISRQTAIAYAISGLTREIDGENWIRVQEVRESILSLPYEQPGHGQWLPVKLLDDEADFGEVDGVECSVCGGTWHSEYWAKTYFKYCPYCGSPMDEVTE